MWRIVVGVILTACVQGQPLQSLLLPEARHIVGVVVDLEGKPIAEANIDHTGDLQHAHQNDSEGRFELDTRAPALVIRKAGFRSVLMRTQNTTKVRLTLLKAGKDVFPTCTNTGSYEGTGGRGASFQFQKTPGVIAGQQGHGIDAAERSYYADTKQGRKGILHGIGPSWSFGIPIDRNVWRSVKYAETTFDAGGSTIIDARGQFPNGNLWRELDKFSESASYSDVDVETAKILDRFLDGACVKPAPFK
jgi:hypothetical protein